MPLFGGHNAIKRNHQILHLGRIKLMTMAGAFKQAKQKKEKSGKKLTIEIPEFEMSSDSIEADPQQVPMMYRAQIKGRCNLQFAGNNQDLDNWLREWISQTSNNEPATYQHWLPEEGFNGEVYRLILTFPFRVISNCGQDSFSRPVIGKYGIPFIPGSGVKGLFERLSRNKTLSRESQQKVRDFCGTKDEPGILRFHGAYPVGDWSSSHEVTYRKRGEEITETRYRISDVVHPQENKQLKGIFKTTAIAQISLYQPTLVFELSSRQKFSDPEWKQIGGLLKSALRAGIGGKTSTGYGLIFIPQNTYPLWINLVGIGVSPTLRNDEPEFRPNLFKATLRGHMTRLLGGVCSDDRITKNKINQWFGYTGDPAIAKIYWEQGKNFPEPATQGTENTPIFKTKGKLYLDIPNNDLLLFQQLLNFSYIMAGWGKGWRRAWHEGPSQWHSGFYPCYAKRAIGCHWESDYASFEMTDIKSSEALKIFLDNLQDYLKKYLKQGNISSQNFKEAWHSNNLTVFSKVVSQSQAIELFHDDNFKTTPAIGGREPEDDRPTAVSCVWHRMLPISDDQYLEIVTVFHGDHGKEKDPWQREGIDQLKPFVKKIKGKGLIFTWGTDPYP
jgi:CRISPR-associated protein Cmr6